MKVIGKRKGRETGENFCKTLQDILYQLEGHISRTVSYWLFLPREVYMYI